MSQKKKEAACHSKFCPLKKSNRSGKRVEGTVWGGGKEKRVRSRHQKSTLSTNSTEGKGFYQGEKGTTKHMGEMRRKKKRTNTQLKEKK